MSLVKSESIKELATALSKAQALMEGAKKDAENPYFHSKYANLEAVWECARKPLTDNGLSVVQLPGKSELGHFLETTLMHSSGEFISGRMFICPVKDDPQGIGSAITYARRYSLMSALGIAPEDDDGELGMGRGSSRPHSEALPGSKADKKAPARKEAFTGNWRDMEWSLPFGNSKDKTIEYKGMTLGQIHEQDPTGLAYWLINYTPKPYRGGVSAKDQAMRDAMDAAKAELSKDEAAGPSAAEQANTPQPEPAPHGQSADEMLKDIAGRCEAAKLPAEYLVKVLHEKGALKPEVQSIYDAPKEVLAQVISHFQWFVNRHKKENPQ